SPWVEANTDGSDAGSRPAAVQAASATSSATATVSGARRRSLGASSCGDGRRGASTTGAPPAMKSRAACQDGSPSVQKPMPSMVAVRWGTSGGPEHERAVVAAEAEGVVHRVAQAARSRVVEMYLRAIGRVADLAVQRA